MVPGNARTARGPGPAATVGRSPTRPGDGPDAAPGCGRGSGARRMMTMKTAGKVRALADLKARIIQDQVAQGCAVWFYPASNGCAGWDGTGPIFCGLIPGSRSHHGPPPEGTG